VPDNSSLPDFDNLFFNLPLVFSDHLLNAGGMNTTIGHQAL
jgi:hypothetical protein